MGMLKINRRNIEVPGVEIRQVGDQQAWGYPRGASMVDKFVLHNILGDWPEHLVDESRDAKIDEHIARVFREEGRTGTHLIIDGDGSIVQQGDLYTRISYNAHSKVINRRSVSVEVAKFADGAITVPSLEALVKIGDTITISLWIQKILARYDGRWDENAAGDDPHFSGGAGHNLFTGKRGKGDPGFVITNYLRDEGGWEEMGVRKPRDGGDSEYVTTIKARQLELGILADGWPGKDFRNAAKAAGYRHGIWALGKEDNEGILSVPDSWREVMCGILCGEN